jgi:hypothetical protein
VKPARKKPVAKKPVANKRRAAAKKPARKPVAKKKPAPKKPAKKPVAKKQAAKKKPARKQPKRARVAPALVPSIVVPDWRGALRAEVAKTGDDFAGFLRGLAATGWEHADTPELAGLEQWGTMLAHADRAAGVGALVRVAQHGFRIAVAAGGIGLEGMGFLASEPSVDGAPVEMQIELAARWLDAPDAAHVKAVAAGNDPSRQLQIWDDDLRPSDDRAHWWYVDVGQCCGHAITQVGGDPRKHSYYDWPPETCVGRGLVVAVRGLRSPRADLGAILAAVRAALVA